jgi:MGT family glycosyltransferase
MAKFMFVVPPFFGHISPTLSIGADLLSRGHSVVWVGLRQLTDNYIPAGGKFIVPPATRELHGEEIERICKRQDDGPSLSGAEGLKMAFEETYIPFCRFLMKGLPAIVDQLRPDVIINDCIAFAGGICAYQKGIPYITSTPVPPDVLKNVDKMPKILQWQQGLLSALLEEYGIPKGEAALHSGRMNMVFTSKEFAGITDPPPHMKFVGPVKGRPDHTPFDWDRLQKMRGPRILVSLGTLLVDVRKDFFKKMVQAFAHQPLNFIAATDPAILEEWPPNFLVQSYIPQSRVMQQVSAVICHGGFNTVNDAILNGLPLLITPIAYDHFHTASLVEASGCGLQLRYKRMRIDDLKAAVWKLLENEKYQLGAERQRRYFLAAGGNQRAVAYLEDFASVPGTHTSAA